MPALLPAFRTPNAILNTCFTKILYGLREVAVEKQHEIIRSLVYLGEGLKAAALARPLEQMEMNERLQMIEKMLVKCMGCDSMDYPENVAKVLLSAQDYESFDSEPLKLSQARSFISGPLQICIQMKMYSILGTAQVESLVG